MFHTNRQSFLAELSSLLTFMQESDRKTALSMYSKMFDDAPSEQELLSHLVSPTRQAVRLARVYDSTVSGNAGTAEFLDEISSAQPVNFSQDSGYALSPENQATLFSAQSVPVSKPSKRRQAWKDEIYQPSVPDRSMDVDAFISGIRVNDEISVAESTRAPSTDSLNRDFPVADEKPVVNAAAVSAAAVVVNASDKAAAKTSPKESAQNKPTNTVTKTNAPLLILYTILAIPFTSLIIVLLILIAVFFLGLAFASGYACFLLISSAFGGFAMFSDIMVVLGVSLVLAALAVLFIWTFIWLLGGVIVAAVKGAINLGGRLCVREVEA